MRDVQFGIANILVRSIRLFIENINSIRCQTPTKAYIYKERDRQTYTD